MATLLNAVSVATVGTGASITGDFEVSVSGELGGGTVELQRAINDVAANYVAVGKEGVFLSEGHAAIKNAGTNFYRAVFWPNPIRQLATPAVTVETNP